MTEPVLSREERTALIESNLNIVEYSVMRIKQMIPQSVEADDLYQVGAKALIKAAEKYRPQEGVDFIAYARHRVAGAILDELRSLDPLSRPQREGIKKLEESIRVLSNDMGREPEIEDLCLHMGITLKRYHDIRSSQKREILMCEMDTDITDESVPGEVKIMETIADERQLNALDRMVEIEDSGRTEKAVGSLPSNMRNVLDLYYRENLSMKDIGASVGLTESRISQIHSQAVSKMKWHMRMHDGR